MHARTTSRSCGQSVKRPRGNRSLTRRALSAIVPPMRANAGPCLPPAPPGFRQHPLLISLAANADGHVIRCDLRCRIKAWRSIKVETNRYGYLQFNKPLNSGRVRVHHVVYECFHGVGHKWSTLTGSGMTINHINGIRKDNRLVNLEAISSSENIRLGKCKHGLPKFLTMDGAKYRLQARVNGIQHTGGWFDTMDLACRAIPDFLSRIGHESAKEYAP